MQANSPHQVTVVTRIKSATIIDTGADPDRDPERARAAFVARRGVPPARTYLIAGLAFSTREAAR